MARRLVVTGASTGIGRAIARAAKAAGWEVLGTVRKAADAEALAAEGIAHATLDLGVEGTIAAGAGEILAWCDGRLDAVVHNAGTSWPGPVELQPVADLRSQFEVNTFGPIALTQHLLPALRAAGGRMIFISSDSVTARPPMMGAYAASKAALETLAEVLAAEVADQGITVSVVAPGPYQTAIWGTSLPRGEALLDGGDPRLPLYEVLGRKLGRAALARPMKDPATLAERVVELLEAPSPPWRVVEPFGSRAQGWVKGMLGTRRFQRVYRWGIDRLGRDPG